MTGRRCGQSVKEVLEARKTTGKPDRSPREQIIARDLISLFMEYHLPPAWCCLAVITTVQNTSHVEEMRDDGEPRPCSHMIENGAVKIMFNSLLPDSSFMQMHPPKRDDGVP